MVQTTPSKSHLSGLARRLVHDGLLDELTAVKAQEEAHKSQIPLVSYLVKQNILSSLKIAEAASEEFGLPFVDLDMIDTTHLPLSLVNERMIRKHNALPLYQRGNRLFVAVSDPTNLQAMDEFKFHTNKTTEAILVDQLKLMRTIEHALQAQENSMVLLFNDADLDDLDISADEMGNDNQGVVDADDAPIVRYVHKILLDAINLGASDIHFEPYEQQFRIRFRQDGILRESASPPVNLATRICARLKIMSKLDISERRLPQDGRFKLKISKSRSIDFRVSTCPTLFGEKVVLRVLDSSVDRLNIHLLGFTDIQQTRFLKAINDPQGMVLATGPTGSGKTMTLYTAMTLLNTPELNISTAEDPIEIYLPGINQVNVNPKAGLDFSTALRCFLRQDPDVVMVGEIRDLETAEMAIKAAQTGHMVLSTLHTNSAPETLSRLMNMGVAPFNIATSVSLIIAQRLARRLCTHCKVPEVIPASALIEQGFSEAQIENITVYKAVGCPHCTDGYKGRLGLYEVMPVTDEISQIIMNGGNARDIAKQARKEGILSVRESGLEKVIEGKTSLEEVNRVSKD